MKRQEAPAEGAAAKVSKMTGKRLLFFVAEDWYFCSHRLPVAIAARQLGYSVSVVTRVHRHGSRIQNAGIALIPIELARGGANPFKDALLLVRLWRIYRSVRPDIVHHVAMKPVLYGTFVAWLSGVPAIVNALAGLGYLFSSETLMAKILRSLVRIAFRRLLTRGIIILQNPDDVSLLIGQGITRPETVRVIRGSGVDLETFKVLQEPPGRPIAIVASRLLWDKGIGEFVEAARRLKAAGHPARFALVGAPDPSNPNNIPASQLAAWQSEGVVELWGFRNDMPAVFGETHIVCLPSYREGLPKALIEAAACGRAIIAADVPGCREIVRHGDNGLLVPLRDASALAEALKTLLDNPRVRAQMGRRGRDIAEAEFAIDRVVTQTLAVYDEIAAGAVKPSGVR